MVAYFLRRRIKVQPARLIAILAAIACAAAILVTPAAWLGDAMVGSGVAAILPAAQPPLGLNARLALAFAGALASGAAVLAVVFGWNQLRANLSGMRKRRTTERSNGLHVRRADAHPDAPPRPPLRATVDLAEHDVSSDEETDSAEVEEIVAADEASDEIVEMPVATTEDTPPIAPVEAELPHNRDLPIAQFDPGAIPETPREPVRPVKPLSRPQTFSNEERFETFELTPPNRPKPVVADWPEEAPMTTPETDATIIALLERLERGVARRRSNKVEATAPAAEDMAEPSGDTVIEKPCVTQVSGSLNDTLDTLRRLAANG